MKTESVTVDPFFQIQLDPLREDLKAVQLFFDDGSSKRELGATDQTRPGEEKLPLQLCGWDRLDVHRPLLNGCGVQPRVLIFSKLGGSRIPRIHVEDSLQSIADKGDLVLYPPNGRWPALDRPWELHLVICQGSKIPGNPLGLPYWEGAILAERRVNFNYAPKGYDFPHHFLTDEEFHKLDYPKRTTAVLHGFSDVASEEELNDRTAYVAIHEQLKKALRDRTGAKVVGTLIRTMVLAQLIQESVLAVARSEDQAEDDGESQNLSVAGRVCQNMKRRLGDTWTKATAGGTIDLATSFALAQAYCNLTGALTEVF